MENNSLRAAMEQDKASSQRLVSFYSFVVYFNSACCDEFFITGSLDQDHARQNVGHDLDPNCLTF